MTVAAPPRPNGALAFIFVTVLIDMLAFGMIIPVLPILVQDFVGGDPVRGAEMYGLFGTAWALMQFIFSPVQGSLSDRFGRRLVILISCAGLGLDFVLMALAPNLWWLLAGRLISGIAAASFSTSAAYISDVTLPEKRAAAFGIIGAAFGVGFVLGPAIGGLLGSISPRLPFWASAFMALANVCWGFFVLPESLPADKRVPFSWKSANPLGSLKLLRSHRELFGLAIVNFVGSIAHEALPTIFVLYAMYRYGWNERTVGLAIAAVGLCSALVGAGLVEPVVAHFGERRTMLAGLLFGTAGFVIYGAAYTGAIFWAGLPLAALWGLSGPPMQGMMTRHVGASEQGQLQGALSSLRGIAFMIGPLVFTNVFASFIGANRDWHLPGAPFLLAALMIAGSTAMAWQTTRSRIILPENAVPAAAVTEE